MPGLLKKSLIWSIKANINAGKPRRALKSQPAPLAKIGGCLSLTNIESFRSKKMTFDLFKGYFYLHIQIKEDKIHIRFDCLKKFQAVILRGLRPIEASLSPA